MAFLQDGKALGKVSEVSELLILFFGTFKAAGNIWFISLAVTEKIRSLKTMTMVTLYRQKLKKELKDYQGL